MYWVFIDLITSKTQEEFVCFFYFYLNKIIQQEPTLLSRHDNRSGLLKDLMRDFTQEELNQHRRYDSWS